MVRMLSIIITAIFIPFIIPNDNLYNDYKQLMKKRYGISITIPDSLVSYENKLNPDRLMFFGESSVEARFFRVVHLFVYLHIVICFWKKLWIVKNQRQKILSVKRR